MTHTRRQFLLASTALMSPAFFNACAGQSPAVVAAAVVQDVQQVAQGMIVSLGATTLDPAVVAKLKSYDDQFNALAASLNTGLTIAQAQPTMQQIATLFQTILATAGGIVPPPYGTALQVGAVLIPIAMQLLQMVAAQFSTPLVANPPAAGARRATAIEQVATEAQARAALQRLLGR